jgi:lipopolysaccharide/colanic/teichoic acid biosynthesis glycosyltransferase
MPPGEVAPIDCWKRRLVNRLPVARYMEAGLAALLFLALLPVLGVLSLGVLLESRGPLLVRRSGTNWRGEPVRLLVFRTTTTTARHGDLRPTRAGSLLRRTGLYEAPLLWHVVRGDVRLSSIG